MKVVSVVAGSLLGFASLIPSLVHATPVTCIDPTTCAVIVLPDATTAGTVRASANPGSSSGPTTPGMGITYASASGTYGSADAQTVITPGPTPTVSASASSTTAPFNSGYAGGSQAVLAYYLELVGAGSGTVSVNINASSTFSTTAIPTGSIAAASTYLYVMQGEHAAGDQVSSQYGDSAFFQWYFGTLDAAVGITGSQATGFSGGFVYNETHPLLANTLYTVEIVANASMGTYGNYGGGTGQVWASVDPVFTVNDPGFKLVLSPGIGNSATTAIPVPATLPLFASGLGILGLLSWCRRGKSTAPAVRLTGQS